MKHTKYYYHVEDGQFSFDLELEELLGIEGNKINFSNYFPEHPNDVYILYINNDHVECIGNVERVFPTNQYEHEDLKTKIRILNRQSI